MKRHLEWSNDTGECYERLYAFRDCPDKGNRMTGYDGYGRVAWTCTFCRGHGGHKQITDIRRVRRPEFDAPTPSNPRVALTGEALYSAWRAERNRHGNKRGENPEPRWKNLKPRLVRVWDRTAERLNKETMDQGVEL